jgi:hypothetical protein
MYLYVGLDVSLRMTLICVDAAVSRGVRQVTILGAGLDTFSLRNPHTSLGLRVSKSIIQRRKHGNASAWPKRALPRLRH